MNREQVGTDPAMRDGFFTTENAKNAKTRRGGAATKRKRLQRRDAEDAESRNQSPRARDDACQRMKSANGFFAGNF
jgi:hypothetical protein